MKSIFSLVLSWTSHCRFHLFLQLITNIPEKKLQDMSFLGVYVEQGGSSHGPYHLSFVPTSTEHVLTDVPLLLQIDGCTVDVGTNVQVLTHQKDILQHSSSDFSLFYYFKYN